MDSTLFTWTIRKDCWIRGLQRRIIKLLFRLFELDCIWTWKRGRRTYIRRGVQHGGAQGGHDRNITNRLVWLKNHRRQKRRRDSGGGCRRRRSHRQARRGSIASRGYQCCWGTLCRRWGFCDLGFSRGFLLVGLVLGMLNERAPVLVGVLIHGSFLKARRCRHWRMRIGGIGRDSIHKRRETRDTLRRAHKDEEQVGWGL